MLHPSSISMHTRGKPRPSPLHRLPRIYRKRWSSSIFVVRNTVDPSKQASPATFASLSSPRAEGNTRYYQIGRSSEAQCPRVPRQTDLQPCSHVVAYMLLPSKGVPFERVDPEFRSGSPIAARCYFYAGQRYTYLGNGVGSRGA